MSDRTFAFAAVAAMITTGFASALAGPLDPPTGGLYPTMKRLDQVEPRRLINLNETPGDEDSVYRIVQPGSYVLDAPLIGSSSRHGIEIAADNVVIDLNGFEVRGVLGSLDGIRTDGDRNNIRVVNGTVRQWRGDGIDLGASGVGHVVRDVSANENTGMGVRVGLRATIERCVVNDNGVDGVRSDGAVIAIGVHANRNGGRGMILGSASTVRDCSMSDNDGNGLRVGNGSTVTNVASQGNFDGFWSGVGSTFINCAAFNNLQQGFNVTGFGTFQNCSASNNGSDGFDVPDSTLEGCTSRANAGVGYRLYSGSTINRSVAIENVSDGFLGTSDCVITNNTARNNGFESGVGAGIRVEGQGTVVDGNAVILNDIGIDVNNQNNIIIRNIARSNGASNTANFNIVANNRYAQIKSLAGAAASHNGSQGASSTLGTTDPWANISH